MELMIPSLLTIIDILNACRCAVEELWLCGCEETIDVFLQESFDVEADVKITNFKMSIMHAESSCIMVLFLRLC